MAEERPQRAILDTSVVIDLERPLYTRNPNHFAALDELVEIVSI